MPNPGDVVTHPLVRRDLHPDRYGAHQPEWVLAPHRDDSAYLEWRCAHCGRRQDQRWGNYQ